MRLLLITLITVSAISFGFSQDSLETRNVLALNGLELFSTPSLSGKKISIIPYGKKVELIEELKDEPFEINGILGHFMKVKYKTQFGYLFSGYTSTFPPPNVEVWWAEIGDYVKYAFNKVGEPFDVEEPLRSNPGVIRKGKSHKMTGGATYSFFGEECDMEERLYLKDATIFDALLIGSLINGNFRDISLNLNFDGLEQHKEYVQGVYKKNDELNSEVIVKMYNSKDDELKVLDVYFESDAGSGSLIVDTTDDHVVEIVLAYKCK